MNIISIQYGDWVATETDISDITQLLLGLQNIPKNMKFLLLYNLYLENF